jgi:hypothetical protein
MHKSESNGEIGAHLAAMVEVEAVTERCTSPNRMEKLVRILGQPCSVRG